MRRRARQLLDQLDSRDLDVDAKVGTLSVANRQRVEIAKALSQDARVLIMDEPTAALADADIRRLIAVVKQLRERGVGIIYVSHKLPEIFELADRVTVLRDGALIGTKPIGEVTEQSLVAMMVGREIDAPVPTRRAQDRRRAAEGRAPRPRHRVQDISFELRRGEILGDRRTRRLGPHRAGADDLRHHARHIGHDHARWQAGRDHVAQAGAQPRHRLCAGGPRACRASCGR
jgi:rhamnose transport system ATP-binding protein